MVIVDTVITARAHIAGIANRVTITILLSRIENTHTIVQVIIDTIMIQVIIIAV